MTKDHAAAMKGIVAAEELHNFSGPDVHDLCEATEAAIKAGGGFGWIDVPERDVMERYWRGVMAMPDRSLIVGRLDGTISGSVQLVRAPSSNQAQSFAVTLATFFVAPWAQRMGVGRAILQGGISRAQVERFKVINLSIRETQQAAIHLFEAHGFKCWGRQDKYAQVGGTIIPGRHYTLDLEES
ncbi:MAG: hypothetical protein Alpg2KO_08590 [Alphaproteobacteria bacterium]